jgi:hypothetical protein
LRSKAEDGNNKKQLKFISSLGISIKRNKSYYENRQLFSSSLISRNSKSQIYRTLVRPVATYGSESWTLSMEEERALPVFERKILRKIYGAVKEKES